MAKGWGPVLSGYHPTCPYPKGYNQQRLPRRCALKVDLRKAYDTVEWDFLLAVLRLFGFLPPFIHLIEECVTILVFSVCINGMVHGFFSGARGFRQGDPMSRYLFVLVMEVLRKILQQLIEQDMDFLFHWWCGEKRLFQLCFADDLIFCKAMWHPLVSFKRGLDLFASLSGLHANSSKSQLIISRSAHGMRDSLISVQDGQLPLLSWTALLASRLSMPDCKSLLLKIDSGIKDEKGSSCLLLGECN
ncbi:UNVERIFIED_CONTAM: hypothetical protein Sradi_1751100 [Sesamum radiatum]|uniref:Reverse transcriptase domain-containing protein n=1 Tax=Sesamum radiatum TaxID=300843 RepID=A0AAW2TUE7_SESRA